MGVYGTMFGVGGGFLIVPVLLWLYPDMEAATVVSAALIVVASNAASGSAAYAWQRRIDFRSGLWLAGASLPGAALGTLAVREVDRGAFEVVFAAALLLVGVYMIAWRGPRTLRPVATSWGTVRRNIRDRKGETYSYGYRLQVALLANAGIIRNRLKITSIIENARRIRDMRESHGGFARFLEIHHPMAKSGWVKLFKKTFKFTGGEIVNEFLMSLGYLPGAHSPGCPAYKRILKEKPPWMCVDAAIFEE